MAIQFNRKLDKQGEKVRVHSHLVYSFVVMMCLVSGRIYEFTTGHGYNENSILTVTV